MKRMSRMVAGAATLGVMSVAPVAPAQAQPPDRKYEVTITTHANGQPLSPPLVSLHKGSVDVFHVGRPAADGVQQVAENGTAATLQAALSAHHGVADVQVASAPLVPLGSPGDAAFEQSVTLVVHGPPAARFLSAVTMLICTNDGFTGVDRLRVPTHIGQSVSAFSLAYDAGSERNTEDFADIVPPCQSLSGVSTDDMGTGTTNPALAENGVVAHHAGIGGRADLVPAIHGWNVQSPLAHITVERVS